MMLNKSTVIGWKVVSKHRFSILEPTLRTTVGVNFRFLSYVGMNPKHYEKYKYVSYDKGAIVRAHMFDSNPAIECSAGIHFYLNPIDAFEEWIMINLKWYITPPRFNLSDKYDPKLVERLNDIAIDPAHWFNSKNCDGRFIITVAAKTIVIPDCYPGDGKENLPVKVRAPAVKVLS